MQKPSPPSGKKTASALLLPALLLSLPLIACPPATQTSSQPAPGTEMAGPEITSAIVGRADRDTADNALTETPATYPGGEAKLLREITERLQYPKAALESKLQGIVILRFIITETGEIGKVTITKSLSPETDREAVRCIKTLSKFNPAREGGRPVPVWFTLPIRFQMR